MRHFNWKHIGAAIAAFALVSIALLWSWNTLAELFGVPIAEYRHVAAILFVSFIARSLLIRRQNRRWHNQSV